jgi:hypothetical protein
MSGSNFGFNLKRSSEKRHNQIITATETSKVSPREINYRERLPNFSKEIRTPLQ